MAQKEKFITVMAVFDDETQAKLQALSDAFAEIYGEDTKTKDIPYHITLGSYPPEDADEIAARIRAVTAGTKPLKVIFGEFGHFGNVVRWLAPEISDELMALHLHFDSDYANGYPGWRPHATIYRHSVPVEELPDALIAMAGEIRKATVTGIELGEFFPVKKIMDASFG
ncbi:MAG: 2'-5' RNA ligase family protein [Oscillospiraceae bacterium]|nr:2'-5' RNA ligase family protein [Oscillospiraceae bacterium]